MRIVRDRASADTNLKIFFVVPVDTISSVKLDNQNQLYVKLWCGPC